MRRKGALQLLVRPATCTLWLMTSRLTSSAKYQGVDAFGDFPDRDNGHDLASSCVDRGYRASTGVGHIDKLAVGSKRNPLRHRPHRSAVGRIDIRERAIALQLQIGQRILEDGVSNRTRDPKRFSIGSDTNPMGGSV